MFITKALPEDHNVLTKLTIASKSYWNYSAAQIEEWIPVLTITSGYIETKEVFKLVEGNEVLAYYSFFLNDSKEILLDNLFVAPNSIGKGLGKKMLLDFFERAKRTKCSHVLAYSDPNSEAFYAHFGFEVIGQEPTSIKNRFLPIMRKSLN